MLTLLLGRDWTANRNEILARIAEDVRQEHGERILIVPELISHDTERRLAAVAGDTSSRFAQVLSFTRLARRIADLVGNAAEETLDNGGRMVAMAATTRQLHSRLKAYAAVETKPEFLIDLVDAIDEFKRCCISAESLRTASEQTEGSLAQKLEELALIMESYDALCSQGKRDPRSQMTWALEQLEEMDFAQKHVFYVDGFPDFTRQHMAILAHLIASSANVTVSLNYDQADSRDPAFETAGRTARELIQIAQRLGVAVHIEEVIGRQDSLNVVRQFLFRGNIQKDETLTKCVKLVRAGSIYTECEAAADQIRQSVMHGARYRDHAIVCSDPNAYFSIIRQIFGKYNIPVYFSGTEDILQTGVIATVLHALDVVTNGFEKQDVLHYIRSVLSPLTPDQADIIENYVITWAISGQRWLNDWNMHPNGLSAQWDDSSRLLLEELNILRRRMIDPLAELRKKIMNTVHLYDIVQAVFDFLAEICFEQKLETLAQQMDDSGDYRGAQILGQLWEILVGALEQLRDVLGNTACDMDVFQRLLRLLLSQYDVGTIPPVLDAVTVGPVSAMRCQQVKHLIVMGADEGAMPAYAGSKGLLSDQERNQLRSLGVPLTGGSLDGLQAEFAEIYGVFCGAEEQITVSSSGTQPSFFYRRLELMGGKQQEMHNAFVADAYDAAAFLAGRQQSDLAKELDIFEHYQHALCRRDYRLGTVEKQNISGIYGRTLRLSASQVDRQAECRLSYFLRYGLRAQERKEATVDPAEFGTYVHAVLEDTAREIKRLGGFHIVDLEETLAIAQKYSQNYVVSHFSQMDSKRLEYLFHRNIEELEMVVRELWRELHEADYEPAFFELQFDTDGQMPAIDLSTESVHAQLRGFVDRVDIWKREDCSFFRVVDYKTGKKEFDYCDVKNGVGLQMLLYLFALEDAGEALIDGNRVSAGVQYFPARAPYVNVNGSMTQEEADAERKKLWKRSGLLLSNEDSLNAMDPSEKLDTLCCTRKKDGTITGDIADRAQMGVLKAYVMKTLRRIADEIASGNVQPNPYTRGTSHNACSFCPYGAVCREQAEVGRRNYKAIKAQQFWDEIGEEDEHG